MEEKCITLAEDFKTVCLNKSTLETNMGTFKQGCYRKAECELPFRRVQTIYILDSQPFGEKCQKSDTFLHCQFEKPIQLKINNVFNSNMFTKLIFNSFYFDTFSK